MDMTVVSWLRTHESSNNANAFRMSLKLYGLLTCIIEHLILYNDLVAVQGFWVHFIVGILVGKVE